MPKISAKFQWGHP